MFTCVMTHTKLHMAGTSKKVRKRFFLISGKLQNRAEIVFPSIRRKHYRQAKTIIIMMMWLTMSMNDT